MELLVSVLVFFLRKHVINFSISHSMLFSKSFNKSLNVTKEKLYIFLHNPEFWTVYVLLKLPIQLKTYPFIFKICLSPLVLHNHELRTLGSQSFYTEWETESNGYTSGQRTGHIRVQRRDWTLSFSGWAGPCLPKVRIHCFGDDLMSSPGGVVLVIFSAFGNWVSNLRLKSSRLSYSFPR